MSNPQWGSCSEVLKRLKKAEYNYCCAVCGCPDPDILSMDRAMNNKGYDADNVQVLCIPCNCYIKKCLSHLPLPPREPEPNLEIWLANREDYRAYCKSLPRYS